MKGALLAVPLVLLVGSIIYAQNYLAPQDPPVSQSLQLLGNGTGTSQFGGDPVTLLNTGHDNLTVTSIAFDGKVLKQGLLGGTITLNVVAPHNGTSWCYQASDTITTPASGTWNMDTGGLCTPTILAGQMATLYIGVIFPTPENHTLVVTTQVGDFVYTLAPDNYTSPTQPQTGNYEVTGG